MRVITMAKWAGVAVALFFCSIENAGAEEIFQFGVDCLNCSPAPEDPPAQAGSAKANHKGARQRRSAQTASVPATYPPARR